MALDTMRFTILPNGTIRTTTDQVSAPNHANAEQFLKEVGRLAGGPVTRTPRPGHVHPHTHTHDDGQTHSH